MRNRLIWASLAALPLVVAGGLVYANANAKQTDQRQEATMDGFTCPVTGETLPCPNCCVLNGGK